MDSNDFQNQEFIIQWQIILFSLTESKMSQKYKLCVLQGPNKL